MLIILASKFMKCKNAKSGAVMLIWRKTAQKTEISQTSIYLCFFEDTGISRSFLQIKHCFLEAK